MMRKTSWRKIGKTLPFGPGRPEVLMFSRRMAELECYPGHPVEIESRLSFSGLLAQNAGYTHWWKLPAVPSNQNHRNWKPLVDSVPPENHKNSVLLFCPKPTNVVLRKITVSNPAYVRCGNAAKAGHTHWHEIPVWPEKIGPKTRPCASCRAIDSQAGKSVKKTIKSTEKPDVRRTNTSCAPKRRRTPA